MFTIETYAQQRHQKSVATPLQASAVRAVFAPFMGPNVAAALVLLSAGFGGLLPSVLWRGRPEVLTTITPPPQSSAVELDFARRVICPAPECPAAGPEGWGGVHLGLASLASLLVGLIVGCCTSACCGVFAWSASGSVQTASRPLARSAWREGASSALVWR